MSAPAQLQSWHLRYPDRFIDERAILEKEGFVLNEQALRDASLVQFHGTAKYDNRSIIVQFPEGFPSFPPEIRDTQASVLLSRHHNPHTRCFCIFGPDSNRWSASLSTADALAELEALLRDYTEKREPQTDTVPEPVTALVSYAEHASAVVPEQILASINTPAPFSLRNGFKMMYQFVDPAHQNKRIEGRGVVFETRWNGTTVQEKSLIGMINSHREISGYVHRLDHSPDASELPSIIRQCAATIAGKSKLKDCWLALIFPQQARSRKTSQITWLLLRLMHDGRYFFLHTYPLGASESASRVPDSLQLSGKKVSMVGCGCLGSKIGGGLAASGVDDFRLFDPELHEPNNSVRHECGVDAFGVPKPFALARRLATLNVKAKFFAQSIRIGLAINPLEHNKALEQILTSDLVIDTTGSHKTSRFLNDICYSAGVPVLYASVTNGAWGGEIVQGVPGKYPCWLCWLNQYYHNKPPSAPVPDSGVFHPGCDQTSFTGTSFETGIVANAAAWAAVDVLLKDDPNRKKLSAPYLRWLGKDEQGDPLMQWKLLPVEGRRGCSICRGQSISA